MENDSKVAMGLGVAGICLAVGGLVFGFNARNQGEEFKKELSELQGLVEKIQRVEESSTGLSANTTRLARDLETLRNTTQDALNRVSAELTSFRRDLNETIQTARKLGYQVEDLEETLAASPAPPQPTAVSTTEPIARVVVDEPESSQASIDDSRPAPIEGSNGDQPETTSYTIRSGDTFSSIASRHGISLNAILDANPDVNPNRLQVGQDIRVPNH